VDDVTITRTDHGDQGAYYAHVEGSRAVGRLTWIKQDGVRVADHTIVPPEIGNRGVAARLVEALVADAREQGFKVQPKCSYVVAAFKRHPEWADVKA
jgi:predicted GNAT family acetyltransferase